MLTEIENWKRSVGEKSEATQNCTAYGFLKFLKQWYLLDMWKIPKIVLESDCYFSMNGLNFFTNWKDSRTEIHIQMWGLFYSKAFVRTLHIKQFKNSSQSVAFQTHFIATNTL